MKILILGGPKFLGFHTIHEALMRGHEVTVFNRGNHGPGHFGSRIECLRGDRDPLDPSKSKGLRSLTNRRKWDAVIDNSGYLPRVVDASAELLAERCSTYMFVSSISVYQTPIEHGADESAPVATMDDPTNEEIMENYGALKALCEDRVRARFGERALIVRPGLIAGPNDGSDRFSYWPYAARAASNLKDKRLVCPGNQTDSAHVIDVRDLATWMVRLLEDQASGTFNAGGPSPHTMGELIYACKEGVQSSARSEWIPAEFLEEHGIEPWSHMPCWLPPSHDFSTSFHVSGKRAAETGLTFRPLADTARDTLDWLERDLIIREKPELRAGLNFDSHADLLAKWDNSRQ